MATSQTSLRRNLRVGIIADTHGVIHPRVPEIFHGVDHILHAGDIGGPHILPALRQLAPVTHVHGNNDDGYTGEDIVRLSMGSLRILLTHILPRPHSAASRVTESLRSAPADIVIFGHSHLPHNELIGEVLYFNPGSAGPKRFDYPIAVGLLELCCGEPVLKHVGLDARSDDALLTKMNQLTATAARRRREATK